MSGVIRVALGAAIATSLVGCSPQPAAAPGAPLQIAAVTPPPSPPSTPPGISNQNLSLLVSENACASNVAQEYFKVTNNTTAPIPLSSLSIKYWINDTSGRTVIPNVWYAGCVTAPNGTCTHPVTAAAATAVSFPACGADPAHQANWEITVSTTDGALLPPGSTWSGVQTAINLDNFGSFTPGSSTWFSGCGSGQPYAPNPTFGLYSQGSLVLGSQGLTAPTCRAPVGQQVLTNYNRPPASTIVGLAPANLPVAINIGLPLQRAADLQTIVDQAADPHSPSYRQWVTPATFLQTYAPSAGDYGQLVTWARAQGFTVNTTPTNLSINVVGTAANVEQAFFVNVVQALRSDGTVFYEPDRQPSISITLPVEGMSGLDNFAVPTPMNTATGPGSTLAPADFRAAYVGTTGACSTLTGAKQTVGLVELADFTDSDITIYESVAHLTGVPTPTRKTVAGNPKVGLDTSGEVPLDIEMAISMAPAAQVISYEDGSVDAILGQMVEDITTNGLQMHQISASWYYASTSHTQSLFLSLAGLGTSFLKATADFGAWQPPTVACSAAGQAAINAGTAKVQTVQSMLTDMEALQYSTLVGGTTLPSDGISGYTAGAETAWSGSGGGVFVPAGGLAGVAMPLYQTGANPGNATVSTSFRNLPDVSMPATNVFIVDTVCADNKCSKLTINNQTSTGGTSASAPLWAGFTALMNEYAANLGAQSVGFLNPALYQVGLDATKYAQSFNDINDSGDGVTTTNVCGFGYTAVAGYDLATGWGSPRCGLITAMTQQPQATTLSVGDFFHACATSPSGGVACWGDNESGQLGAGQSGPNFTVGPFCAGLTTASLGVSVAANDDNSCTLLGDGTVWCWGDSGFGQLGDGVSRTGPVTQPTKVNLSSPAAGISVGDGFACAILPGGAVDCWGHDQQGQVGCGGAPGCGTSGTSILTPTPVADPSGSGMLSGVRALSASDGTACAARNDGTVVCWGEDGFGQLGDGRSGTVAVSCGQGCTSNQQIMSNTPVLVQAVTTAVAVSVGNNYACALLSDTTVVCWGMNIEGQLGTGTASQGAQMASAPVQGSMGIGTLSNVASIAAGAGHTCALLKDGSALCWGDASLNQLGNAANGNLDPNAPGTSVPFPVPVDELAGPFIAISPGNEMTCAMLANHQVWCWGQSEIGDLGNGSPAGPAFNPAKVNLPASCP